MRVSPHSRSSCKPKSCNPYEKSAKEIVAMLKNNWGNFSRPAKAKPQPLKKVGTAAVRPKFGKK